MFSPPLLFRVCSLRVFTVAVQSSSFVVLPQRLLATSACVLAGHSKWQNIKHTKAAKDREKSIMTTKAVHKITVAIKEGGGTNPETNSLLRKQLEIAKANNVSSSTLQRALDRAASAQANQKRELVGVKGHGGVMVIVELMTDKPMSCKNKVRSICNKFGCQIADEGIRLFFDEKGIIRGTSPEKKALDDFETDAIEAGAEEATEVEEEDGKKIVEFITDPQDLDDVNLKLNEAGYSISNAGVVFIPKMLSQPLNPDQQKTMDRFLEKLEEMEEIMATYTTMSS